MRLERKFSKLLRIAISCSFLFAFFIYRPAQAQCGSTGGSGTPSCPGTIYRPGAYDDAGTDDPLLGDGYYATTQPSGPLYGTPLYGGPSGSWTAALNAGDDYIWVTGTWEDHPLEGDCTWYDFPNYVTSTDLTLHIPFAIQPVASESGLGVYDVYITIGSSTTSITGPSAPGSASGEWTATIPAGTNLSTVSVYVRYEPTGNSNGGAGGSDFLVSESLYLDVYIQ